MNGDGPVSGPIPPTPIEVSDRHPLALALAALVLVPRGAVGDDSSKAQGDARRKLIGTWEARGQAEGYRQLKYITPAHFIRVIYDVAKKNPVETAGGTWSLHGDAYKETVEFASDGWEHLRGKKVELTSKVDGDKWTVSGTLDNGFKIDETWDRQTPKK